MEAFGLTPDQLQIIKYDAQNNLHTIDEAFQDFTGPMREGTLVYNATDSLSRNTNATDSRLEGDIRKDPDTYHRFEQLTTGGKKVPQVVAEFQNKIKTHFEAAIMQLKEQLVNLDRLEAYILSKNFSDQTRVAEIRSLFKYFKITHQPGMGAIRFSCPLTRHNMPQLIEVKLPLFKQQIRLRRERVEKFLLINQQQLKGTKAFVVKTMVPKTPERKKIN